MDDNDVIMRDVPNPVSQEPNGGITDSDIDGAPAPETPQVPEDPTMAPVTQQQQETPTAKGQAGTPYPITSSIPTVMSPPGFTPKAGPERFNTYTEGTDATPVGSAGTSSASSNPLAPGGAVNPKGVRQ